MFSPVDAKNTNNTRSQQLLVVMTVDLKRLQRACVCVRVRVYGRGSGGSGGGGPGKTARRVVGGCPKISFKRLYTFKGLLVLVEKASFSKTFRSEFHSGREGLLHHEGTIPHKRSKILNIVHRLGTKSIEVKICSIYRM